MIPNHRYGEHNLKVFNRYISGQSSSLKVKRCGLKPMPQTKQEKRQSLIEKLVKLQPKQRQKTKSEDVTNYGLNKA